MSQSVERFSSRVENYAKYRPDYPDNIVQLLKEECGLTPQSVVADIGSGTGKLSQIFLTNGNRVIGVEPNSGMRAVAEKIFKHYSTFESINGTAEASTLADSSVDFVTAGQAFHWFDPGLSKVECGRILRPGGWMVLVWNDRKLESTPFLENYEALLLKYGTDYGEIRHDKAEPRIADFFSPAKVNFKVFPNEQVFDFAGLKGRVLSSSYTPEPQHPDFEPMLAELRLIFDKHQHNGHVVFDYDTKVFYGRLPRST